MLSNQNFRYWDNVWNGDDYSGDTLRRLKARVKVNLLFERLAPQENWSVIDFGCGPGYIAEEMFGRTKCKITCIDSSSVAIEVAKRRLKNLPIDFICSDVSSTDLPSNSFDLIICCGIIEHVENRNVFLGEIYRLLKPNGYLFITSSNLFSFILPQRLIKQLFCIWPFGYQVNMSVKQLKKLVISSNFSVAKTDIINDIGDYKILGRLDSFFAKFSKQVGRYIVLIGEKR